MQKLKEIFNKLKEYKVAVIILGVILFFVVLTYFINSSDQVSNPQDPSVTNGSLPLIPGFGGSNSNDPTPTSQPNITPTLDSDTFSLVQALPENGSNYATIDTFTTLEFTYTEPIDPESIEVVITPLHDVTPQVSQTNPNLLMLRPQEPWRDRVQYSVRIDLKSVDGKELNRTTTYRYFNTPPIIDFSEIY